MNTVDPAHTEYEAPVTTVIGALNELTLDGLKNGRTSDASKGIPISGGVTYPSSF